MDFEEAKFKAIKYVGISKKTKYEVTSKLKKIGVEGKVITDVLKYLEELDYVNDLDYVDSYIRQNIRSQKYSIYEITEKLKVKGNKILLIVELVN
jgi:SOS response regulatory protein OraA/RecX